MNDVYITPFEECIESVGSEFVIAQEGHVEVPLVSFQFVQMQDNIYEIIEIDKRIPSLKSYEDKAHKV